MASCDLGTCKPSPEYFLKIRNHICPAESEDIFLIDDSLTNIESAEQCGFIGIHFDPDLNEKHNAKFLFKVIQSKLG